MSVVIIIIMIFVMSHFDIENICFILSIIILMFLFPGNLINVVFKIYRLIFCLDIL